MIVYYIITKFNTNESITVQSTAQTVKDLKRELARQFHISDNILKVDQKQDRDIIKEYSTYNITISSFSDTTYFLISNKKIAIHNFNDITINQIIERFKQEGFYYSDNCLRQIMHFKISGNGGNTFDVIVELKGEIIQLYYDKKFFTFSYFSDKASDAYKLLNSVYGNVTIFKSNSTKLSPREELEKNEKYKIVVNSFQYGNPESINITKDSFAPKNRPLFFINDKQNNRDTMFKEKKDESPKSKDKYSLLSPKEDKMNKEKKYDSSESKDTEKKISFYNIINTQENKYFPDSKKIEKDPIDKDKYDYLPKSKELEKKRLINDENPTKDIKNKNKYDYSPKSKETETINNSKKSSKTCEIETNKEENKNQNQKPKLKVKLPSLTTIQTETNDTKEEDSDEKLLIFFVFDDKYKHHALKKEFSINTTIEKIIQIITDECHINDKIAIKYQEEDVKYEVDHEMTIDDIRDEMKEKIGGKIKNILYVQPKVNPNQEKPKPKTQPKNQKSKEIDLPKNKNKTKNQKYNTKEEEEKEEEEKEEDDEDDDDEISHDKKKSNNNIIYYQVNSDPEINEFKLEHDTTVKNMKEFIAEENEIDNYNKIKIIFAGKELLDDIVLEKMNIGDIKLFVYFQTIDEILLLTAKALRVNNKE